MDTENIENNLPKNGATKNENTLSKYNTKNSEINLYKVNIEKSLPKSNAENSSPKHDAENIENKLPTHDIKNTKINNVPKHVAEVTTSIIEKETFENNSPKHDAENKSPEHDAGVTTPIIMKEPPSENNVSKPDAENIENNSIEHDAGVTTPIIMKEPPSENNVSKPDAENIENLPKHDENLTTAVIKEKTSENILPKHDENLTTAVIKEKTSENNLPKHDDEVTTLAVKEETLSDVEDFGNIQINDDLEIKEEKINLSAREEMTTNVITVRIRKKRGAPRKSDPFRLYSPDMFQSLFGFSIFNCQRDSEWRDVLKKKVGSLHFRSNGTRISDPLIDIKPLRLHQQQGSKRKTVKKKSIIKNDIDIKVNYKVKEMGVLKEEKKVQGNSTNEEKRFQCEFCYLRFKGRNVRKKHMDQVHFKIRRHKCDYCEATFYNIAGLKKHRDSVHLKLKPHKCKFCEKSFASTITLKNHYITHDKIARFECPICKKKIRHKQTFDAHMDIHANVRYSCTLCSKSYSSKKLLGHHILTHDPKPNFQCSKCSKYFVDTYSLRIHERHYHSQTVYQCARCKKTLASLTGLRKHMEYAHDNVGVERTFKCDHCEACFSNKDYLRNHVSRLHTDTLHCMRCPSTFPNKNRLESHMRVKHGSSSFKPFPCSLCDRRYFRKTHLRRHMKSHEKRPMRPRKLFCQKCGKQYQRKGSLQNHILLCK